MFNDVALRTNEPRRQVDGQIWRGSRTVPWARLYPQRTIVNLTGWIEIISDIHTYYTGIVSTNVIDSSSFRENIEWTREGFTLDGAFAKFVGDSLYPDRTPFRLLSELNYPNTFKTGNGDHPVLRSVTRGSQLSEETLLNRFSSPLVPPLN